mmetsp:Transcript_1971/g.7496  ORF Transcript_1971/g.7496 Transcript_1971/m.7496 type:complete len:217 (+) Transcript_1971:231-881(+)
MDPSLDSSLDGLFNRPLPAVRALAQPSQQQQRTSPVSAYPTPRSFRGRRHRRCRCLCCRQRQRWQTRRPELWCQGCRQWCELCRRRKAPPRPRRRDSTRAAATHLARRRLAGALRNLPRAAADPLPHRAALPTSGASTPRGRAAGSAPARPPRAAAGSAPASARAAPRSAVPGPPCLGPGTRAPRVGATTAPRKPGSAGALPPRPSPSRGCAPGAP